MISPFPSLFLGRAVFFSRFKIVFTPAARLEFFVFAAVSPARILELCLVIRASGQQRPRNQKYICVWPVAGLNALQSR